MLWAGRDEMDVGNICQLKTNILLFQYAVIINDKIVIEVISVFCKCRFLL